MTKRKTRRVPAARRREKSSAASKGPSERRAANWQSALERNLRAEGYSEREASQLVEIAAS